MKKTIRLFLCILIFFIIFLIIYLSPRDYELEYIINNINIEEEYNKEKSYYEVILEYKNKKYKFIGLDVYNTKRKIINEIEVFDDKNYVCLIPKSDILNFYPICKYNGKNIDYHLVDILKNNIDSKYYKQIKTNTGKYKNIKINYVDDKTYIIWNYSGLDIINKDGYQTKNLFNKDVYNISLAFLLNNNLVIPDYENDYYFDKYYIYNVNKNNVDEWQLKSPIYFDSYLLGYNNKSAFIFDKKQDVEYELVPHKKKIRSVSPRLLTNNGWEKVSLKKLSNKNMVFEYDELISYKIKDNKLYKVLDDYEILLSNNKVKEIISYNNDEVYYLVEDILYKYSPDYGEIKIMSNFEWNFNYENMIFVY